MNSTVKLFIGTALTPEKNFIIEDIASFLNLRSSILLDEFQYQRHSLQKQIKVNLSQARVAFSDINRIDYCSIQNEVDTKPVYYFVVKKTEVAVSTILIDLVMDVCNSFVFGVDYQFTPRSRILREHKDRFYRGDSLSTLMRKIDFYSEGLNPSLYKEGDDYALPSNKWSLVFKNQIAPSDTVDNPVLVYAAPDETISIQTGSNYTLTKEQLIKQSLTEAHHYYFSYDLNQTGRFEANGTTYTLNLTDKRVLLFYRTSDDQLSANFLKYDERGVYVGMGAAVANDGELIFLSGTTITRTDVALTQLEFPLSLINSSNLKISFNAGQGSVQSATLKDIDRTDPSLIKIIKLPYPPFEGASSGTSINIPSGWTFDSTLNLLRLTNINVPLESTYYGYDQYTSGFPELYFTPAIISTTMDRDDQAESKMYHSEFYQKKFVYDSFSFQFYLEKLPEDYFEYTTEFQFKFKVTSTINSRFMFTFTSYNEGSYAAQDYPYVMLVTRNNETTLFNNSYINYINTAYNYDLKTNERNVTANWVNVVLSGIGTGINLATGSNSISVASATSLGKNTIAGIYNAISSQEQMEQNLEAKKAQLMQQSTSVIGSDDVDLMESYSGNQAKIVIYTPSEKLYNSILDLFHYTGYISNELKVPDINTRYWWNYLQADPEISPISNLSNDIILELQNRFKEGMTFFHKHNNYWNTPQTRENWETWIIALLNN